jgi:hypothetical protein
MTLNQDSLPFGDREWSIGSELMPWLCAHLLQFGCKDPHTDQLKCPS